ncbi:hypothetical protein EB118_14170 [bacterium]|nr:hypothetical protein [bacterium]NDD85898.1 hypothetical protein [bacterium]NDG31202.1 hypothetical protein [bacterium]
MNMLIKNPTFRFLHKDSKVYYISKKGVCFGTNEYLTVPVQLNSNCTNCLVGYTNKLIADSTVSKLSRPNDVSICDTSCKELQYISSILGIPLVVLMESPNDIFYNYKNKTKHQRES